MSTQQPEALRLADRIKSSGQFTNLGELDAAAAELYCLHAENVALQQCYDAARLEIDHLRGGTHSKLLAQPVAWMVYLPSIDTQNIYDSQDDPGYVDDVTNHADAEVTPLYEMAATKAEVAPAGEYPPLPEPLEIDWPELHSQALGCGVEDRGLRDRYECAEYGWQDGVDKAVECVPDELYDADQMRTYADATCAMRAQAAPVAHGDAQQRAMDARHAAIYRWIIQHIDKAASIIDAWREDGEADKDELHDALAARAANAELSRPGERSSHGSA